MECKEQKMFGKCHGAAKDNTSGLVWAGHGGYGLSEISAVYFRAGDTACALWAAQS